MKNLANPLRTLKTLIRSISCYFINNELTKVKGCEIVLNNWPAIRTVIGVGFNLLN